MTSRNEQIGFTKPGFYPGYVNISHAAPGLYTLSVRADPTVEPALAVGALATISMSAEELRDFLRDATNLLMSHTR